MTMREKELRLALVCYGGISLAIYMHGVTKEVWRVVQASRAQHDNSPINDVIEGCYRELFSLIDELTDIGIRVLADIVAGASAGGINGIFLSQAIATGQSLEPLTQLWLENADVEKLLDPDARPLSRFSKFWATPIAWYLAGRRGGAIAQTVSAGARDEVRAKLSGFVRARWFEPPFGGAGFSNMLLDAFDAMAAGGNGPRLLPSDQPLDLFVTVTDFHGHADLLRLNSPAEIIETEHRMTLSFRDTGSGLGAAPELVLAARATASFPGAFPPFSIGELDGVVTARQQLWPGRDAFLARIFPGRENPAATVLIDGSVLANAPFRPAIAALRDRPARREVDRRFVYIDPKPGVRSVRLTKSGKTPLPGFAATIFGALSDIPREQPIRDSLEAIEERSARIRRMQRIIDSLRPNVEATIESLFGLTFFFDRPTPERLDGWRAKAQASAARGAGFAYGAYGHVKLSGIVEEIAALVARQQGGLSGKAYEDLRQSLWSEVRARGIDAITDSDGRGASKATIAFFRAHDLGFRVRRLRFVIRTLASLTDTGRVDHYVVAPLRTALFQLIAAYIDREGLAFYQPFDTSSAAAMLDDIARQRGLESLDRETDRDLAGAFAACPKAERRTVLYAYLGFPYYDISTLPMLQGEGLDEFDPIKVDRISPDDAVAIRQGVKQTLKGVEFNSFGAFFSRSYRENDYLWGRLHGADRLFDIICSTVPSGTILPEDRLRAIKHRLLIAILDEEEPRLAAIAPLFGDLRREIAAGPLSA